MKKLIIYGRDGCEPCASLKAMLKAREIPFTYVDVTKLGVQEAAALRASICAVSRLETATVPAAEISAGTSSVWISNHGEVDITSMCAEIRNALA